MAKYLIFFNATQSSWLSMGNSPYKYNKGERSYHYLDQISYNSSRHQITNTADAASGFTPAIDMSPVSLTVSGNVGLLSRHLMRHLCTKTPIDEISVKLISDLLGAQSTDKPSPDGKPHINHEVIILKNSLVTNLHYALSRKGQPSLSIDLLVPVKKVYIFEGNGNTPKTTYVVKDKDTTS